MKRANYMKEAKKYKLPVIKSYTDVKNSIGNRINKIVITSCGT